MISKCMHLFLKDRRAATALIVALMAVPLIITSGAAVDFSRVSSARAQLQYAVDSAALAGAGAYQVNKDGTVAYNVAKTAFNSSTTNLNYYASVTSAVATSCNPSGVANVTCGTTSAANGTASNCPSSTIYCVQVTAHAVLQNSLLAFVIPSDVLNVTSAAQSTGTNSVGAGNFHHVGVGFGSDLSAIYAYAVPTDSAGNPQYNNVPTPNSYCASSSYGPIQYEPSAAAANGISTCNYVLIGENSGGSGTGSIAFQQNDPLGFTFVNFTGGTITSGTSDLDTTVMNPLTGVVTNTGTATHYSNQIYVTATTLLGISTTLYYSTGDVVSGIVLYGTCPAHNLYGSINAYPNATPGNNIVPYQDSINTYSSAWELLGYPPTHGTNHVLLPFLGPATGFSIPGLLSLSVRTICPQWPTAGTAIAGTTSFSPSNLPSGYTPVTNASGNLPVASNVPVFSTYYPDVTYAANGYVFPPAIAGCTPATSSSDGGTTPSAFNPWWGWSPPNNTQMDPGGASENPGGSALTNCTSTKLNSGATAITATQNATQSTTYNDCAFLIQPLGTNVPANAGVPDLPDYYTYAVTPAAFAAGTTGNPSNITSSQTLPLYGMTPVYDGIGNSHAAGYVPSAVSITGTGPYTVTEPPLYGTDAYPPEDTSHQCYNPKANGIDGSLLPGTDQPNNDSPITPIDPVANPELGAVYCNSNPPPAYALFWNDMGSYAEPPRYNDDLGYANAVTEFTCPTPGNPGTSGPPALIY
jgi:Flp pilus assembly protein TadG